MTTVFPINNYAGVGKEIKLVAKDYLDKPSSSSYVKDKKE